MRSKGPAPFAEITTPDEVGKTLLVIESEAGKVAFLAWAEKHLREGEAIVEARGVVGRRRAFRTVPLHERAELVAIQPPLVLRGGVTSLVSYYRVPADALDAQEMHYEDGELSHAYDIRLKVATLGRRRSPALVNA